MLSKTLLKAMSAHMTAEYHAAFSYLSMAAWFEAEDLAGFANFYRVQAHEEMVHGMKFFDFICEAGVRPEIGVIAATRQDYSSPRDVFEAGLEQERGVSKAINNLMDVAQSDKNHATKVFLQWFVTEQLEEEALFGVYLKKLQLIGDDGRGIVDLDRELAQRGMGEE